MTLRHMFPRLVGATLVVVGLLFASPLQAQTAPTPQEMKLVLHSTALALGMLKADASSIHARALLTFSHTLDPHYAPASAALEALEENQPTAEPILAATSEDVLKQLLAAAATERVVKLQLLYYAMSRVLDPQNAEAKAALIAASQRGEDVRLSRLLEDNERLALSEVVPYSDLLKPHYLIVVNPELEARRLDFVELELLSDRFRARQKADEADERIAKDARSLLGQFAALDKKREESLERLERAKNYVPTLQTSNKALYQRELEEGRSRQIANVKREWAGTLDKYKGSIDRALADIIKAERALADKMDAGSRNTEVVRNEPKREPPKDDWEDPPVRQEVTTTFIDARDDKLHDTTPKMLDMAPTNLKFDPTNAKTPDYLKNQVLVIAQWLTNQQTRTGKLANRIFAEDDNGRMVLYMEMTPEFMKQKADARFGLTKAIQEMWARRCKTDGKVPNLDLAFFVTLDEKLNVVGGSSDTRGTEIWVKREM